MFYPYEGYRSVTSLDAAIVCVRTEIAHAVYCTHSYVHRVKYTEKTLLTIRRNTKHTHYYLPVRAIF